MSTHSLEYQNAIAFFEKYKKAYSSISGLRNDITPDEIVQTWDKQLQDKDFLNEVKRKQSLAWRTDLLAVLETAFAQAFQDHDRQT